MNKPRFSVLAGMILAAAGSRLLPHPPNFSPVAAMAFFGGANIADKRTAFLVPMLGLFLSDLVLGFYSITPVVYGSFALIVCLGFGLGRRRTFWQITGTATAGAVLFFILSNFGVWALETYYPKTLPGLAECYLSAIPFFGNTLLSDLFYSGLLFGGLALAETRWPILIEEKPATVCS